MGPCNEGSGKVKSRLPLAGPMRAAYFEEHGDLDVLRVGDLPSPELNEGSVRIRVKACALNHLDLWVRMGGRAFDLPTPHVGGTDLAGVVTEVAGDVADRGERDGGQDDGDGGERDTGGVSVGDEVLVNPGLNFFADTDGRLVPPARPEIVGETRWGGLAEECVVPAANVLPKPEGLSWTEAAALPLTALTARQMTRKARVGQGDRVLIPGAGGGVSTMAVQICKALGAWVCATTSTGKTDAVAALGADEVLDYKADPEWSKKAFYATEKKGYDVVIDSVGQATWAFSIRSLAPGGRLVTCGATTGPEGETDIRQLFWKQASIHGSTMGTREDLEDVLGMVAAGTVTPVVDSVWPLADVRDAVGKMERGEMVGKIVLEP